MEIFINKLKHFFSKKSYFYTKFFIALFLLMLSFFAFANYAYIRANKPEPRPNPREVALARSRGVCQMSFSKDSRTIKHIKYIPTITNDDVQKAKDKKAKNKLAKLKRNFKKIDRKAEYPYKIRVNRMENFVTIMGINKKGQYKIPYKTFVCSTAKNKKETPLGSFQTNEKYRWHQMVDGSYAQYAIRIVGGFMLHSIPYYSQKPNSLETKEYNKLGSKASLGCVRMRIKAIKWIYDNCPEGTPVEVYNKRGEKPAIALQSIKKLDPKDKKSKWDPTDPHKKNPWK